jgi:hypothetical protein
MQNVQPGKRPAATAHFLHRRGITAAPGIGELCRIASYFVSAEEWRHFTRNAAAPIDKGAKNIEHEGSHAFQDHGAKSPLSV